MRLVILSLIVFHAFSALSCGPYSGPMLNPDEPTRLVSCPKPADDDRATLTFNALLMVLDKNHWAVTHQSMDTKTIDARRCKNALRAEDQTMAREQSECLDIHMEISVTGTVALTNPQEHRFYWKIKPKARTWIEDLERDFEQARCYSINELAFWRQTVK